jgi:hypothetical protein
VSESSPHEPTSAGPEPEEALETVETTEAEPMAAEPAGIVEPEAATQEPAPEPVAAEPEPVASEPAAATPEAEPTPVVGASEASFTHPPGTAAPVGVADERPEVAVGAAFAGGLVTAWFLKRIARRRQRR